MPFEESMSCKKLLRMNSVSIMRKSWVYLSTALTRGSCWRNYVRLVMTQYINYEGQYFTPKSNTVKWV